MNFTTLSGHIELALTCVFTTIIIAMLVIIWEFRNHGNGEQ